jgi:hypothetical protein
VIERPRDRDLDRRRSGFHDHDRSAGAIDGAVIEDRLRLGRPPSLRRHSVSYAEELRPLAPAA